MNGILNGTCWGERHEDEIKIAPWLTHEWKELDRKINKAEEHRDDRSRSRVRVKRRKKVVHEANQWEGLSLFLLFFIILALIGKCI